MKIRRKEEVIVDQVVAVECDRCHELFYDIFDLQEMLDIRFTGGYGSTFWGDMTSVEVDLCEKCSYELFKDFAITTQH